MSKLPAAILTKLGEAQAVIDQAMTLVDQLLVELHGTSKGELLKEAGTQLSQARDNVSDVRRR